MTLPELLARHIDEGPTGIRHRGVWLDSEHWRCMDCAHTLDLSERPSSARPTSTSSKVPPTKDQACPLHGGWAENCPGCRGDQLAAEGQVPSGPSGAPMPKDFREQVRAARSTRQEADA